jgi:glycosyltransferase involved in cell wall biosynthesis
MKTISLICGKRYSVFDFYNRFKHHAIRFISGSDTPGTNIPLKKENKLYDVRVKNATLLDPIALLTSKTNNLSWKYFNKMEEHLENTNYVGLYDTYYFWNYQAVQFAKQHKIPTFCEIWCNIPNHITSKIPPYSLITKEVLRSTELFILRNAKAKIFTDSLGIPSSKIKQIYMGIDLEHFKPKKEKTDHEKTTILYVGNLIKEKGILELLNAFRNIYKKNKNIAITIAGDGPLKNKIQEFAKEYPLDYQGFVPYEKLPDLYASADIFCSPSHQKKLFGQTVWQEYFSYTLMEAQACGLPIVATTTGGIPEEVDEKNILIDEKSTIQLEHALVELLDDTTLRKEIGNKNRIRAIKLFNAQIQSQQTEQAIMELV